MSRKSELLFQGLIPTEMVSPNKIDRTVDTDWWGKVASDALQSGTGGFLQTAMHGLQDITGDPNFGKEVENWGADLQREHQQYYEPGSARYYASAAMQSLPEMSADMIASMGVAAAANAALGPQAAGAAAFARGLTKGSEWAKRAYDFYNGGSRAAQAARYLTPAVEAKNVPGWLAATATSTGLESAFEGQRAMDDYIAEQKAEGNYIPGVTEQAARDLRYRVARDNAALLTGSNAVEDALIFGKGKGFFGGLGRLARAMAVEGAEEGAQQIIPKAEQGKDWSLTDRDVIDSVIVGGLMGGGMHLGGRGMKAAFPGAFGDADMPTQGADIDEQVKNLKGGWDEVIPQIGGVLKNQFGLDGVISSGARTAEHNAEVGGAENSYHIQRADGGDALDIVLPDNTTAEQAEAIKQYFKDTGMFDEVLFHDVGSGYHLHLGGLKGGNIGGQQGGGQREGHANAWAIHDVFRDAGYNENAIAGILGRVQQEHNFDTSNVEEYDDPETGLHLGGYGMFQWNGSRTTDFLNWAKQNNLDPQDATVQARYALQEAQQRGLTPEKMNNLSAEEAADLWTSDWEVGKPGSERQYANEWLERIKKGGSAGTGTTAQNVGKQFADGVIDFAGSDSDFIDQMYQRIVNSLNDEQKSALPGMFDEQGAFINTPENRQALAENEDTAELIRVEAEKIAPEYTQSATSKQDVDRLFAPSSGSAMSVPQIEDAIRNDRLTDNEKAAVLQTATDHMNIPRSNLSDNEQAKFVNDLQSAVDNRDFGQIYSLLPNETADAINALRTVPEVAQPVQNTAQAQATDWYDAFKQDPTAASFRFAKEMILPRLTPGSEQHRELSRMIDEGDEEGLAAEYGNELMEAMGAIYDKRHYPSMFGSNMEQVQPVEQYNPDVTQNAPQPQQTAPTVQSLPSVPTEQQNAQTVAQVQNKAQQVAKSFGARKAELEAMPLGQLEQVGQQTLTAMQDAGVPVNEDLARDLTAGNTSAIAHAEKKMAEAGVSAKNAQTESNGGGGQSAQKEAKAVSDFRKKANELVDKYRDGKMTYEEAHSKLEEAMGKAYEKATTPADSEAIAGDFIKSAMELERIRSERESSAASQDNNVNKPDYSSMTLDELKAERQKQIDDEVQRYKDNPGGQGVNPVYTYDENGNINGRYGESLNPQWYQDAYKKYNGKPPVSEYPNIALDNLRQHQEFDELEQEIARREAEESTKSEPSSEQEEVASEAITEEASATEAQGAFGDLDTVFADFAKQAGITPVEQEKAKPAEKSTKKKAKPKKKRNMGLSDTSKEKEEELIKQLKKALNKAHALPMFDPDVVVPAFNLGRLYVQRGIDNFADYARQMIDAIGDEVRSWLHPVWEMIENYPEGKNIDESLVIPAFRYVGAYMDKNKQATYDDVRADFVKRAGEDTAKKFDDLLKLAYSGAYNFHNNNTEVTDDELANSPGQNPEGNSAGDNQDQVGADNENGESGRRGGRGVQSSSGGSRAQRGGSVHGRSSSGSGKASNSGVQGSESQRGTGEAGTRGKQLAGSRRDSFERPAVDDGRDAGSIKSLADRPNNGRDSGHKAKAVKVNKSTFKAGDRAQIAGSMPFLMPEQVNDVVKADERLYNKKGEGMMFTNGTGTGKTFTGLGCVERAVQQGKKNILIIAPSDKVQNDWITAGKGFFGLDIKKLENTKDAGNGIVITSYENVGANNALLKRDWDMIVSDESHKLMQGEKGNKTQALENMRAMTYHHAGLSERFERLHADEYEKLAELAGKAHKEGLSNDEKQEYADLNAKLIKEKAEAVQEWKTIPQDKKPKVLFLSATPFSYVPDIEYGEGYLFHYDKSKDGRSGYNKPDGRQDFMIKHFGYRMRYGKLTQPAAEVNSDLMEVNFNNWLKQEGVLSGRKLTVKPDYERGYILVDGGIGKQIDEGMKAATEQGVPDGSQKYSKLHSIFQNKLKGNKTRYLLEAIKAKAAVDLIKEYNKEGKKVVVFHDFKKNEAENPFVLTDDDFEYMDEVDKATARRQYEDFCHDHPELINLDLKDLQSPIERLTAAFGDSLRIFNGDIPKGKREKAVKEFNDDNSKVKVILCQRASAKEGISMHDTTGKHQRVLIDLGLATRPTDLIQGEGRIYRTGVVTDAIIRYLNTGTDMEKRAFASTIAGRASTAENLSMGEDARALRQAIVDGYMESLDGDEWKKYLPGSPTEGKGGKEKDSKLMDGVSPYEAAKSDYFANQKKTSRNKAQEGVDYYATPEPIGFKMVEWLGLKPGDRVLEPSAGHGAISRYFSADTRNTIVEPSGELATLAKMRLNGGTTSKVVEGRFEDLDIHNKYEGIAMNPPYGLGGKTAYEHVEKAFDHLSDGGRLIAIVPDGPAANKRFNNWFYGYTAKGDFSAKNAVLMGEIKLPQVAFKRAGTNVATRILIIDKYTDEGDRAKATAEAKGAIDLTGVTDINELFDKLENRTFPERVGANVPRHFTNTTNNKGNATFKYQALPDSIELMNDKRLQEIARECKGYTDRKGGWFEFRNENHRAKFVRAANRYLAGVEEAAVEQKEIVENTIAPAQTEHFEAGTHEHTKTKEKIPRAKIKGHVDRKVYEKLAGIAKNNGGYYSRAAGAFLFENNEAGRDAFLKEAEAFLSDDGSFSVARGKTLTDDECNKLWWDTFEAIDDAELTPVERELQALAKSLGATLKFCTCHPQIQGRYMNGVSYVNRNARVSESWIAWHEMFHWIKAKNQDLYDQLVEYIKTQAPFSKEQLNKYRASISRPGISDERAIEEMLADAFPDVRKRVPFFENLAKEDVSLYKRLVSFVKRVLDEIVSRFYAGYKKSNGLTVRQASLMQNAFADMVRDLTDGRGHYIFKVENGGYRTFTDRDGRGIDEILPAFSVKKVSWTIKEFRETFDNVSKRLWASQDVEYSHQKKIFEDVNDEVNGLSDKIANAATHSELDEIRESLNNVRREVLLYHSGKRLTRDEHAVKAHIAREAFEHHGQVITARARMGEQAVRNDRPSRDNGTEQETAGQLHNGNGQGTGGIKRKNPGTAFFVTGERDDTEKRYRELYAERLASDKKDYPGEFIDEYSMMAGHSDEQSVLLDVEYFSAVRDFQNATNEAEREDARQKLEKMVEEAAKEAGFENAIPEQTVAYKTRTKASPKKSIKVYKVFTVADDGSPTALFVGGTEKLPQGVWLDAMDTYHFQAENGSYYVPSTKNPNSKGGATGTQVKIPNEQVLQDLKERGYVNSKAKVGTSITALAYRPGWHAGTLPFFPQGGTKIKNPDYINATETPDVAQFADTPYPNVHRYNQVVFECELAFDKDYNEAAQATKDGDLEYLPEDGSYYFATNPLTRANPELGAWVISGSLKIGRALTKEECDTILEEHDMAPQQWEGGQLRKGTEAERQSAIDNYFEEEYAKVDENGRHKKKQFESREVYQKWYDKQMEAYPGKLAEWEKKVAAWEAGGKKGNKPSKPSRPKAIDAMASGYGYISGDLDLAALGYTGPQHDAARKTLAPITYDDNGEIIPLSRRFDSSVDDVRYSVARVEEPGTIDRIKNALTKLIGGPALADNVENRYSDKQKKKDSLDDNLPLTSWMHSMKYLAGKNEAIKRMYYLGKRCMDEQEHLRNEFGEVVRKINKLMEDKEERERLQALLWAGDAEGREYTADELKEAGFSDNVISAYKLVRENLAKAYSLVNDARMQVKVRNKTIKASELKDFMKENFIGDKDIVNTQNVGDGKIILTYRGPKVYTNKSQIVDEDTLKSMEENGNIYITDKQKTGEGVYFITYNERPQPMGKLTGYMPHFFHRFMVYEKRTDNEGNEIKVSLGSAESLAGATEIANKLAEKNPDKNFVIDTHGFTYGDENNGVVIGDLNYEAMTKQLAANTEMNLKEANEFLHAKAGASLKSRHRFFGNMMKRTGAEGFDQNMMWALTHYFNSASRYVAMEHFKPDAISWYERFFGDFNADPETIKAPNKRKTARIIRDYINDVNGNPRGVEKWCNAVVDRIPILGQKLNDTYNGRPALALSSKLSWFNAVTKLGCLSVSSPLLNFMQFINVATMLDSVKYAKMGLNKALNPSEFDKKILDRSGIMDEINLASDAGGYTQTRDYGGVRKGLGTAKAILDKTMFAFTWCDALMRKSAVLGAYYQGVQEKGMKPDKGQEISAKALEYAREVNSEANFDYSAANTPEMIRMGSVVTQQAFQFQKYPIMQFEFFWNHVVKGTNSQRAKFLAPYFVLTGLPGMVPFGELLAGALGLLIPGDDDDFAKKMKAELMRWAGNDSAKQAVVNSLTNGPLAAFTGIDISERAGMQNFFAGRYYGEKPQSTPEAISMFLGGATVTTAAGVQKQVRDGNVAEVFKAISPGLGNIIQGWLGETRTTHHRVGSTYDGAYERILHAMGFRHIDETNTQFINSYLYESSQRQKEDKKYVMDAYLDDPTPQNREQLVLWGISDKELKKYDESRERSSKERAAGQEQKKSKKPKTEAQQRDDELREWFK